MKTSERQSKRRESIHEKKQNNMNLRIVSGVSDEVRVITVSEFNCVSQWFLKYHIRGIIFLIGTPPRVTTGVAHPNQRKANSKIE